VICVGAEDSFGLFMTILTRDPDREAVYDVS